MPLFAHVVSRLSGRVTTLDGPWSLGRWSLPVNTIGLVYLVFAAITFNFPTLKPVDSENM